MLSYPIPPIVEGFDASYLKLESLTNKQTNTQTHKQTLDAL